MLTALQIEPLELYQRMGYTEAQLEAVKSLPFLTSGMSMAVYIAVCSAPLIIYLLYVKRFFPRHVTGKPSGPPIGSARA